MEEHPPPRPGFRLGFGLSGLLSAALAYFAFDFGLFSGPLWRGSLVAIGIGVFSGGVMLWLDRRIQQPHTKRRNGAVKLKGPWACPNCGEAYVPEATVCSDCNVPLVGTRG